MPQLLVSVRSEQEAREAVAGGCDILDVKEPDQGPLGAASVPVMQRVAAIASEAGIRSSAALGETTELMPSGDADATQRALEAARLNPGFSYLKAGPAGLRSITRWESAWTSAAQRIVNNSATKSGPRWVAVAYADWSIADAPSPIEVLDVVIRTAGDFVAGVLIDTYDKSGGSLLDLLRGADLLSFANRVHQAGRFLALAGRLRLDQIADVAETRADILAVRSAACEGGDRRNRLTAGAVRRLKDALQTNSVASEGIGAAHVGQLH